MADEPNARRKPRRVKGCHNCSQRRINCDQGTPCQKCVKKGLQCSGLGIRYRFNNGVASRGNLAGEKIPVKNSSPDLTSTYGEPTAQEEPQYEDALSMSTVLPSAILDHLDRRSRFLLNYCMRPSILMLGFF
ncbi:uncharacterized protein N7483_005096 [Penicillium malachiteum]|uniref:uncharacterized protein n=1 Tax=Penicillium malachiteum TaxID=1324776 RepID=UPI002548E22B|nr:uncharacterized protein N7483_005096 [Penicillium malachiteum]KAJ5730588.1 hypothetical protein N7483_005096 [Penicillium malachiteum]